MNDLELTEEEKELILSRRAANSPEAKESIREYEELSDRLCSLENQLEDLPEEIGEIDSDYFDIEYLSDNISENIFKILDADGGWLCTKDQFYAAIQKATANFDFGYPHLSEGEDVECWNGDWSTAETGEHAYSEIIKNSKPNPEFQKIAEEIDKINARLEALR